MNGADELAELRAQVAALDDEVTILGSVLEDVRTGNVPPGPVPARATPGPPEPPEPPDAGSGQDEPVMPFFGSLLEFVVEHFAPVYARSTGPTVRWCAHWWDHAEALYRLEALWRTWELYRLEPRLGIASWLRDYLDPQLRELTSPTGPFASCTEDRHSPAAALRTNQPPEAYLLDL